MVTYENRACLLQSDVKPHPLDMQRHILLSSLCVRPKVKRRTLLLFLPTSLKIWSDFTEGVQTRPGSLIYQ